MALEFLQSFFLPISESRLRLLAQNQLTKGKKEIWEIVKIGADDKRDTLIFLSTANKIREVGTF